MTLNQGGVVRSLLSPLSSSTTHSSIPLCIYTHI